VTFVIWALKPIESEPGRRIQETRGEATALEVIKKGGKNKWPSKGGLHLRESSGFRCLNRDSRNSKLHKNLLLRIGRKKAIIA